MMGSVVAISMFSSEKEINHIHLDDEFYFDYLSKKYKKFIFYTSKRSANQIFLKHPNCMENIRVMSKWPLSGLGYILFATSLKIPQNSKVIFFGYSERLILFWYLFNIRKSFNLILVTTNNFSAQRIKIYHQELSFFLRFIRSKLVKIVMHTDYEAALVKSNFNINPDICCIKKHHLMIPKCQRKYASESRIIKISFFGPPKPEKPLQPIIQLIKACKDMPFSFQLYNVSQIEILNELGENYSAFNVDIFDSWLSYDEHFRRVAESDLIFMSHTSEYEGKLSGNLCDCISFGIPFIAAPIEPLVSMNSLYGDLGYLCDFSDPQWTESLISNIKRDTLNKVVENIKQLSNIYSLDNITQELDQALEIPNA